MRLSSPRNIVLLSTLAALCLGVQLAPRPPNIEFTTLIVFLVGAVFGPFFSVALGGLVMFINGFFSPYGFAGLMMPFQITGMIIVGAGGGFYGRSKNACFEPRSSFETAVLGAFLTLVYDFITNLGVVASSVLAGVPFPAAFASAMLAGAIFSLVHVASNSAIFGAAFYPLTKAVQAFLGGEDYWRKEPSTM